MLDNPEASEPNKKLILFFGGLIGLLSAKIIAYFLDKKTDIIFDINEIVESIESQNVLNYMNSEDLHNEWKLFLDYTDALDKFYKTNYLNVYDEYCLYSK